MLIIYLWLIYRRRQCLRIAIRYGLDGPGIESWWGRDENRFSSPRVKRPRHGVNHPVPPSAEVKETAELYLYSLSLNLHGLF